MRPLSENLQQLVPISLQALIVLHYQTAKLMCPFQGIIGKTVGHGMNVNGLNLKSGLNLRPMISSIMLIIEDIESAWHDMLDVCVTDIEISYEAQEFRICQEKEWVACATLEFGLEEEKYQTRTCITEEAIKGTLGALSS